MSETHQHHKIKSESFVFIIVFLTAQNHSHKTRPSVPERARAVPEHLPEQCPSRHGCPSVPERARAAPERASCSAKLHFVYLIIFNDFDMILKSVHVLQKKRFL